MNKSLHIGLNKVSPAAYDGWWGILYGCHNDAREMERIARSNRFVPLVMLDSQATVSAVLDAFQTLARDSSAGDTIMITYSGHGGQIPDRNGDEKDGLDETWCLFDGMLPDDTINAALARFKKGVRIIIVSDSCHSGTVTKNIGVYHGTRIAKNADERAVEVAARAAAALLPPKRPRVIASVVQLGGCADNQLSYDGEKNGLFTGCLIEEYWSDPKMVNYTAFRKAVSQRMPAYQTPQLITFGGANRAFVTGPVFSTLK